ncbi:MAG: hypothetical protein WBV60_22375 [Terriglobales bacterium]
MKIDVPQRLKSHNENAMLTARLKSLRKKCHLPPRFTAAAKAVVENKPDIAAVNRCATQKQDQNRVFPQAVKPCPFKAASNCTTTAFVRDQRYNSGFWQACGRVDGT